VTGRRLLALALATTAPQISLAGQGVRARLAGRVPPLAMHAIDSIVLVAGSDGLPTEPLIQKALEGGAKGAPPDRIVAAVGAAATQLRVARALLELETVSQPPQPSEITAVAAALARGVRGEQAERLAAALPGEPMGPALHAVADLEGHGIDESAAVALIVDAAHAGLRGLRLLDVAAVTVQALQSGKTPAAALAQVRAALPDIPLPPRPGAATMSRARRPQHPGDRP
jgi:hypothetical protein